jgi:tRNA-specific 2-thiouridylase
MASRDERIIVGLSGGVDSAVSALVLQSQGYRVEGLFMKNWEDDDTDSVCCAADDRAFAAQVCDELGIALHQANFAARYRAEVFEHCLGEFRRGRTPNPDVLCNRQIKFGALVEHARRLGADALATGHYADVQGAPGERRLLRAGDRGKDQTYFLHALSQDQLDFARFPLASYTKDRVREMAADAGFDNFNRKDSTGICFIGERDFRGFLARYIEPEPGPILTFEGEKLGEHMGLAFYTIGQRRGLDLGGRGDTNEPWYVAAKEPDRNALIVVQGHDHPALFSDTLLAGQLNWIAGDPPEMPLDCTARSRYRQADQPCRVHPAANGVRVCFREPQRALTPGQYIVFYDGEICLGGGVIEQTESFTSNEATRVSA